MSKDKKLSDTLSFLTGGKIPGGEIAQDPPTKQRDGNPQTPGRQINEQLKQHNFRMRDSDWEQLRSYFESRGLGMGAGLRMVLIEYMKKNGIRN